MSLSCYLFTMKGDHSVAAKRGCVCILTGEKCFEILKELRDSVATPEF